MAELDDMPPLQDQSIQTDTVNLNSRGATLTSIDGEVLSEAGEECSNCSVDDELGEEDSNDWEEMDGEDEVDNASCVVECLFCEQTYHCTSQVIPHMQEVHKFGLQEFSHIHCRDQIEYIKMINFIRQNNPTVGQLSSITASSWNHLKYMKPVLIDDPLLCLDVENVGSTTSSSPHITSNGEKSHWEEKCQEMQEIIIRQRQALQRLLHETENSSCFKKIKTVGDLNPDEDEGYFNSYAYFDIHHEMLSDRIRTESYRDAIFKNASQLTNKTILDVGCGTGILSMFCAKAGAIVTGVDMSDVIFNAMEIVKENGFERRITLRKGRIEDLNFKHQFDFIVSEWMGYFLLFEGMLDSVIYARDEHLKPGGMMLPNRCTLYLTGMEDMENYKKFIQFWDNVYGFKMSCMRRDVTKESTAEIVKPECILTTSFKIADFDLMKMSVENVEFMTEFCLTVQRDGFLTGFVGYFDIFFDLEVPVSFSTGPDSPPTHWKQTIFYLPRLRNIKKDEVLKGQITVRRKHQEVRSLDVTIYFDNKKLHYLVE